MNATGLIIGGQRAECSMPVYNWHDTGKEIVIGKGARKHQPKQIIDLAVWHWTGGEGDLDQLHEVLTKRGYGVECFISRGKIYQLADPLVTDAYGAGPYNPRAVNIEIQNYGFTLNGKPAPKNDRGVRPMIECVQGGRKRKFAAFFKEDLDCVVALGEALSKAIPTIPAVVPTKNGAVYPDYLTPSRMRNVKGHVGHYHLSTNKADPGPEPLRRLLESGVCQAAEVG